MLHDWATLTYLQTGTPRQQLAYPVLVQVMAKLADYQPVLAGTIPLDIDLPESDLDVICHADELEPFAEQVRGQFSHHQGFRIGEFVIGGQPSIVANFWLEGFQIEVFGQARPVVEQSAYRHMAVEARLLRMGGERAKWAIRSLKAAGMKTEPAFAQYFGLAGDPYQALLDLYGCSDRELSERVKI